jgi:hypothetical protein
MTDDLTDFTLGADAEDAKVFRRDSFDCIHAGFDNQPAMVRHFVAAFCEQFGGVDSMMSQEAVHAMRILVTRAVVVKRYGLAK